MNAWPVLITRVERSCFSPHVDDLPELVDRPVQIDPPSGDFYIGLVYEPPVTGAMPAGPGRVDQQRGEPLHPAIDRDMVYLDAALGEQLFHVAVGQPVAQLPPHRQHDDLTGEAESSETQPRRRYSTMATAHQLSLPDPALRQRNNPGGQARRAIQR